MTHITIGSTGAAGRAVSHGRLVCRGPVNRVVRQKTMRAHWTEIESWLKANAPAIYEGLNPPASAQQVADAEKALGVRFPADCVASFQIHNGQKFDSLTGSKFLYHSL